MILYLLGLVLFFGLHLMRVATPDLRRALITTLGVSGFRVAYSVATVLTLALLVYGFGLARAETGILYDPPVFLRHLTLLLMLIAAIILAAGCLPAGYIAKHTKHPMVLSIKIWALAHLLANGETAQVILFTAFLAYGVILRIAYKRRLLSGESAPRVYKSWTYDIAAILIGGFAYLAFVVKLHELLIGVPVM